jgi:hypothetical protein
LVTRRCANAHGLRRLFVREAEVLDQALQALRFLQRVQVLALDVLDQRHRERRLIGTGRSAPAFLQPARCAARQRARRR